MDCGTKQPVTIYAKVLIMEMLTHLCLVCLGHHKVAIIHELLDELRGYHLPTENAPQCIEVASRNEQTGPQKRSSN